MGMVITDRVRHPGDGDLVRLLDGAMTGTARHHVEAHVDGCERCGERFAQLRQRSDRLCRLLGEQTEVEWLPTRRVNRRASVTRGAPRRSWGRYAVAAGLVLAVVVAGPARGWIVEGVRTLLGDPTPEPSVPALPVRDEATEMAVTFAPEGDEVLFWLAEPPARGTLELQATDDGRITAAITGHRTSEEIIVVPNGVRVRNTAASVAGYALTVGRPGTRVRLRIGAAGSERETVLIATSQLTSIDLGAMRSR